MYAEVTVIVDGALEQTEIFHDYLLMGQFIQGVKEDAEGDGFPTEVYIQEHDHELTDEDCQCAFNETDHHSDYSWNSGA